MDGETDGSMLPEAEAAYKGVRGDPRARRRRPSSPAGARGRQPEAHLAALHDHAWAEHEAMRNEVPEPARRALRVAMRAGPAHRQGSCWSAARR